jgi:antitoxin YefM
MMSIGIARLLAVCRRSEYFAAEEHTTDTIQHKAVLVKKLSTNSRLGHIAWTYEKAYALNMHSMNASEAREKLYRLLDETANAHEPVLITGPRANAVLIGEEDWNSIQETLYLLSVPGMRESIKEGLQISVEDCEEEPGW